MAKVLVFAETISQVSLELLSNLTEHDLEIVSIGIIDPEWTQKLKQYGVKRINLIQKLMSGINDPEIVAAVLSDFIRACNFDYIFTDMASLAKDVFPRLSAIFNSALVTSVVDFECTDHALVATKTIFAGECLVDVELIGPKPWFVTVDSKALAHFERDLCGECEVVMIDSSCYKGCVKLDHIREDTSEYLCLEDAEIIVSGGRGLRDSQDMKLLEDLAEQLGASVGVSLGAVESDIAPRELLIGQSGSSVAPSLYIACGISGATQHMTGLRNAKRIMAINSDPDAPIMRVADYAVIGNLYKILPKITALISEKRKKNYG